MTKIKVLSGRRKRRRRRRRRRRRLSSVPFKVNSAGGTKSKISSTQVTSSPLLPSFGTFFLFFSSPQPSLPYLQGKHASGEGRDAVCWPRISPTSHAAAADPLVTHTLPKAKLTASAAHWPPSGSPSHPGIAPPVYPPHDFASRPLLSFVRGERKGTRPIPLRARTERTRPSTRRQSGFPEQLPLPSPLRERRFAAMFVT